jgi:hypothetical protein
LICILTRNMLPEHYEPRHRAQQIGFEGPDLAEKHRCAVLASAKTISLDLIRCVGDTQFRVASQSNLGRCYLVDIQRLICDCPDFPRVRFCKHLCAVKIWYPFIAPLDDFTQDFTQDSQRSSAITYQMSATSSLSGEVPQRAIIPESGPSGALPNQDRLSPNQNLWAATAKKMGARTPPKRRQPTPPKRRQPTHSAAVPSSTSQHIGAIGVKRKLTFTDAYSSGERSGKLAKSDAVSAAANLHARSMVPQ